jgi:hypothetical protein
MQCALISGAVRPDTGPLKKCHRSPEKVSHTINKESRHKKAQVGTHLADV